MLYASAAVKRRLFTLPIVAVAAAPTNVIHLPMYSASQKNRICFLHHYNLAKSRSIFKFILLRTKQ